MKQSAGGGLLHCCVSENHEFYELLVTAILGFAQTAAENGKQF